MNKTTSIPKTLHKKTAEKANTTKDASQVNERERQHNHEHDT